MRSVKDTIDQFNRDENTASRTSPHASRFTPNAALVIFGKAPIAGQVKTRLCPPLTPDEAATLHGSFLLDMLERTKTAVSKLKLPMDRYVACAPSASHVFFQIMEERQGVRLIDQIGDDLGARMAQAFSTMFARGYARVLIVGTDVPTLPIDHFTQALAMLETHDLVLGPSRDGGYYLIGLRQATPELFAGIPWSSERVLAMTVERATSLGLTAVTIAPWRDVDTIDDLTALIEAAASDSSKSKTDRTFSARTAGVLQLLAKRLRARA